MQQRRTINVRGVPFEIEITRENGRKVATIYHAGTAVYRDRGDPHDYTNSGIRAIIEDGLGRYLPPKKEPRQPKRPRSR